MSTGLIVSTSVLAVALAYATYRCFASDPSWTRQRDRLKRTGADRRRTLAHIDTQPIISAMTRATDHLTDKVTMRSYYRNAEDGSLRFVRELFPATAVLGADYRGHAGEDGLKGVILFCHGFADNTQMLVLNTLRRFAAAGYAVFAQEYVGHGSSDGLHIFIDDPDQLINDNSAYFDEVRGRFPGHKYMVYGESLGGAVAFHTILRQQHVYDGVAFVAPMVKIADEMKPPEFVINILLWACKYIPKAKIVPSGDDLIDKAFKRIEMRSLAASNPLSYTDKHQIATAKSLLWLSTEAERRFAEFTVPFIVVHGDADVVTVPACSQLLHETAGSKDKTIKLYTGAWHALTVGEPEDFIEGMFQDLTGWFSDHSTTADAGGAAASDSGAVNVSIGAVATSS